MIGDCPELLNVYLKSSPDLSNNSKRSLLQALTLFPIEETKTDITNPLLMLISPPLDLINLDFTGEGLPDC
jgi:hypothetical protein